MGFDLELPPVGHIEGLMLHCMYFYAHTYTENYFNYLFSWACIQSSPASVLRAGSNISDKRTVLKSIKISKRRTLSFHTAFSKICGIIHN